jgi:5-methyltetrahydrofolate--homocysteine methyltransferase
MGADPAPHPLERLLAARGWVLADGAMATTLFDLGLTPGEAPERWVETHPERIRALHAGAVKAGAEVILTNSFGANAVRLAAWGAAGRAEALNRAAAEIAREAAGHTAIVAGSMGPTGGRVEAETVAIFEAQARALMAGGADLVWLETFGDGAEFRAAAEGAARAGAPWCGTMSFEAGSLKAGGRSRGGLSPADLVALVAGLPHAPLAFGANCGAGPAETIATIAAFRGAGARGPLIAKANAGLPRAEGGRFVYDVTPAGMADYAVAARAAGARIVGGCCGVTPDHLRAMRAALDERSLP